MRSIRRSDDLEEAEALIQEALAIGIRTIIDVVPNHVSEQRAVVPRWSWMPSRARPSAGTSGFRSGEGEHGDDDLRRTGRARRSEPATLNSHHGKADGSPN